ncbi:MAG: hypothetical protein MJZ81_09180 [Bacteroidales bacterium]|nr:hypothetical protein [Bacteroidales bacterium]
MENSSDIHFDRKSGPSGIMMVDAGSKCRSCGIAGCRLHWNVRTAKNPETGKKEQKRFFYCDCECHMGVVTGWYENSDDAIEAWKKGIWVEDKKTGEEK